MKEVLCAHAVNSWWELDAISVDNGSDNSADNCVDNCEVNGADNCADNGANNGADNSNCPITNLSSWQRREWLEFIGRPSISVEGHHRLSNHFRLFPMPEVPLSRCWPSSEMPGILCFEIVGSIEACAAQLSSCQVITLLEQVTDEN